MYLVTYKTRKDTKIHKTFYCRYDQIVEACSLKEDFNLIGDETEVSDLFFIAIPKSHLILGNYSKENHSLCLLWHRGIIFL